MTAAAQLTRSSHVAADRHSVTFLRLVRSEWIKIATLRSTWWSIAITGVLTVGIAALIAASADVPGFDAIQAVVSPIQFTMLLAGILGAISVTGEYSTGMIRSTLTANPVRGAALAAKAVVIAAFLFIASLVIFTIAAFVVTAVGAPNDVVLDWSSPEATILPIIVASLAMAVFALIGVGFGYMLRSGAGAIAATVGVLFVLPIVASMFSFGGESWAWILDLANYLPMVAAQSAILPGEGAALETPVAYLTLAGWVAASMIGAWASLRTRDA